MEIVAGTDILISIWWLRTVHLLLTMMGNTVLDLLGDPTGFWSSVAGLPSNESEGRL